MKRGQSALEYLVTYGWAILAIVIIAAVLWYTGVFNPSKFRGGGECGGFGKFTCSDFKVTSTGGSVILGNSVGRQITVYNATVGIVDCSPATEVTVAPNGLLTITCTSTPLAGTPLTGAAYDINVQIGYTDSQSNTNHSDQGGFLRGKVE
ncbi:MAG: hypothetical protein V1835_01615 [Candidatus Micrarchaeota archaeon]